VLTGVVGHASSEAADTVDETARLSGTLIAVATGKVSGTQFRSEAVVRATPSEGMKTTFELRILAGLAYEFTFIPDDTTLPTFLFSRTVSTSARMDIVLPRKDAYRHVNGVVVTDALTNTPISGALVSCKGDTPSCTSAITDSEGQFSITLEPGDGTVTIRVALSKASIPFPTRTFVYDGDTSLDAESFQVLSVGPIPATQTISLQVVGDSADGFVKIPSAQVLLSGQAAGGDVSASGLTDAEGLLTLSLLEGTYAVAVLPGAEAKFASTQVSLDLSALQGGAFVIPLEARARVSGQVLDRSTGAAVQNVAVSLITNRLLIFENLEDSLPDVSFSAVTDADGRFDMGYDPGQYAISITPSSQSGLPRFSQPNLDLSGGDKSLTIRMSDAALVKGRISDVQGTPVSNAQVQFFFYLPQQTAQSIWALQDNSFSSSIQVAGTCRTDADGNYALVLPVIEATEYNGDYVAPVSGADNGTDGTDASAEDSGSDNVFGLPVVEVD